MGKRLVKEELFNKLKNIHNNKYDYSKSEFINTSTKIIIICPIHDEYKQTPKDHLTGRGCPECGRESSIKQRTKTNNQFICEAKKIHGNNYIYDEVKYVNSDSKVKIICLEHGAFEQTPTHHLSGQGCPVCRYIKSAEKNKYTNKIFITKATNIHGDKYDYSKIKYINDREKVCIVCPIHGDFWQTPNNHTNKYLKSGCPKCGRDSTENSRRDDIKSFIEKSIETHGNTYIYDKVNYLSSNDKVEIICKKHGYFWQKPSNHIFGQGCKKCFKDKSNIEKDFLCFIKSIYDGDIIENDRTILKGKELDVYIPEKNIAFEVNGLMWHSEKFNEDKKYHLKKTELCNQEGIKLIHIFEDEWYDKNDIIKSMVRNTLKLNENKIYARKCQIREINRSETVTFLNNNHIQGYVDSKIKIGLFYDNNLVSVMTFGSERLNLGRKSKLGSYEMLRYCSIKNTNIIGGASKLLSYFIKKYNPNEIISYANRRFGDGDLYVKLKFDFIKNTDVNYSYVINKKRENRFKHRKDILVKNGYDKNKTEHEIMLSRGIYRIYDCGTKLFKMKLKND